MSENKEQKEQFEDLKRMRDEIVLKSHLLNMELKEEWEKMEDKFEKLNHKWSKAIDVIGDAKDELLAANSLMIDELKKSYKKIKENLQ